MVSPLNPFKSSSSLLHEFDRLKMVELATSENFKFRASDVEFNMPKPSYTADTLAYISDKHPDHEFKLIIGEDNLLHFHKWKNHEVIFRKLWTLCLPKASGRSVKDQSQASKHSLCGFTDVRHFATFIRKSIRNQHSVQYLLPAPVVDYIRLKKILSINFC